MYGLVYFIFKNATVMNDQKQITEITYHLQTSYLYFFECGYDTVLVSNFVDHKVSN